MREYQTLLRLMGRVIARAEPLGEGDVVDTMLRLKTDICRRLASRRVRPELAHARAPRQRSGLGRHA